MSHKREVSRSRKGRREIIGIDYLTQDLEKGRLLKSDFPDEASWNAAFAFHYEMDREIRFIYSDGNVTNTNMKGNIHEN